MMLVDSRGVSEPAEPRQRSRIRVRAWHIVLLIVAVITSLLLAYWQWTRYQSGTGTFQNLGYALQWPFFGAFFVYAYRVGLRMENEKIDAVNEGRSLDELYQADLARYGDDEQTEIDHTFLPPRPELDVEEFNALNQPRRGQYTNEES
ncbi:hypothetical protein ACUY28_02535 [Corynebacterium sanguinis]|uniref:Uncharacterized protein n=1 Tax=Corynebacterium sanguinis TaxID=2594913 RepID=A0A6C1TVC2_9CORY|nr:MULTISPECIES: hypothetical protein [Corynebacterium]MBA4505287.1 hypothetical protein [Corynebacterium sanguinis]MCT1411400.1 hypothetical protein [Corynebacterium sanguinis]MCT1414067.1 hypothetical protein [Corynebacterium sanguinis]MCT1426065.1 hypothetical protein [Corynebacterium sanguinis]MCT1444166.1 hypothetical protein [Corynebacterium sanguinis]